MVLGLVAHGEENKRVCTVVSRKHGHKLKKRAVLLCCERMATTEYLCRYRIAHPPPVFFAYGFSFSLRAPGINASFVSFVKSRSDLRASDTCN